MADSPEEYRGLERVAAIEGDTLAVKNRRGTFEILTDDETTFRIRGIEDPSIKDIHVGDLIAGRAIVQKDGMLLAQAIAAPRPAPNNAN